MEIRASVVFVVLGVVVAAAGCKAKAQPKMGAYVPVLAQLAASPKAQKPKAVAETKEASTFTYDDTPGLRKVQLVVAKDRPKGWKLSFESTGEKFSYFSFDPNVDYGAMTHTELPKDWTEITNGPLKGNVAHVAGAMASGACLSAEVYIPRPLQGRGAREAQSAGHRRLPSAWTSSTASCAPRTSAAASKPPSPTSCSRYAEWRARDGLVDALWAQ